LGLVPGWLNYFKSGVGIAYLTGTIPGAAIGCNLTTCQ